MYNGTLNQSLDMYCAIPQITVLVAQERTNNMYSCTQKPTRKVEMISMAKEHEGKLPLFPNESVDKYATIS